jgi:dCMP deaminase
MNERFKKYYSDIAERTAKLSRCIRLKTGAIIVKNDKIISYGYNGTPSGWDNNCERRVFMNSDAGGWMDPGWIIENFPYEDDDDCRYKLETLDSVLHSESNAIAKLAKSNESGADAIMFCTHSSCIHCAKMIYQAGITALYYKTQYRCNDGIQFLIDAGVHVTRFK